MIFTIIILLLVLAYFTWSYISTIIIVLFTMVLAIVLHELGHAIAYYFLTGNNIDLKIKSNLLKGYIGFELKDVGKFETILIQMFGILFGIFPIFWYALTFNFIMGYFLLCFYYVGCGYDFFNMLDNTKELIFEWMKKKKK